MHVRGRRSVAPSRAGIWRTLPRGGRLPDDVWLARHRGILALLWLHVPVIFAIVLRDDSVGHAAFEAGLVAGVAGLAHLARPFRRLCTALVSFGLFTCSAILIHLSGGLIEMHFHYFVMIGVVTLYQEWWPFLQAVGYVVAHHTLAALIDPSAVYNHPAAVESPVLWAGIHGFFILGMSATGIVTWRLNEALLDHAVARERGLAATKEDLLDALSLLHATLDATADGVLVVDLRGGIASYNRSFVELWAMPPEALDAADDAMAMNHALQQLVDPAGFTARIADLYAHPRAEAQDTLEFLDGRIVERSSRPQLVDDEVVGRVWTFRDVTENARLAEELSHQALHDSLTNIANQALFRDRVDRGLAVARERVGHLAVLLVDIDDFKMVNDGLGRPAGDELLVAVSQRIRKCLRSLDTIARLGGDEFAVLVEDPGERSEAECTAARVLEALREPFEIDGNDVVVGASIGIAVADVGGDTDTDQLLRNADLAMYAAKNQGKNRAALYSDDMHVAAVTRVTVESELRQALEKEELRVHYQPLVSLATGEIVGAEALVRWEHPVHGLWAPGHFIDVAETSGLIVPLGRWVLTEACRQAQSWNSAFTDRKSLRMSVNVSAHQLHDGDLAGEIGQLLGDCGLDPSLLTVEVTESAMIKDFDATLARLEAVKALGVHLAIDDFGTGYSTLAYLQRLPADVVKIDRSFVQRIGLGAEESALAKAIVKMAQSLDLTAVAEGIETAEQASLLVRLGCDLAQGYWFSRPVDADAFTELLEQGRVFGVSPVAVRASV